MDILLYVLLGFIGFIVFIMVLPPSKEAKRAMRRQEQQDIFFGAFPDPNEDDAVKEKVTSYVKTVVHSAEDTVFNEFNLSAVDYNRDERLVAGIEASSGAFTAEAASLLGLDKKSTGKVSDKTKQAISNIVGDLSEQGYSIDKKFISGYIVLDNIKEDSKLKDRDSVFMLTGQGNIFNATLTRYEEYTHSSMLTDESKSNILHSVLTYLNSTHTGHTSIPDYLIDNNIDDKKKAMLVQAINDILDLYYLYFVAAKEIKYGF